MFFEIALLLLMGLSASTTGPFNDFDSNPLTYLLSAVIAAGVISSWIG